MGTVIELRTHVLKGIAQKFVDIYTELSPRHAAAWVSSRVEKHEHDRLRHLITKEFEKRGYKFPNKEDDTQTENK